MCVLGFDGTGLVVTMTVSFVATLSSSSQGDGGKAI
jgi:hypothetical protein